MINNKTAALAALLVAGAVVGYFLVSQSDETKIKKKFNTLAEKIEKQEGESDLMAAAAANQIEKMFGPSVRIKIPSYSVDQTFPNNEVSPHVLYARSQYTEMQLKFQDFQFQFPEENHAVVGLTANFQAVTAAGEPVDEIHEAECTLEKIDDEWLFMEIWEQAGDGQTI